MTDRSEQKLAARAWFESLRDAICAEFTAIEREAGSALLPHLPGVVQRRAVKVVAGKLRGMLHSVGVRPAQFALMDAWMGDMLDRLDAHFAQHRFLFGDVRLATELHQRLRDELFRNTGPQFIEAKLAERAERHRRQGGQRYVLEPNVKEGKGGLRDLQTLYWIAKYLHNVEDFVIENLRIVEHFIE